MAINPFCIKSQTIYHLISHFGGGDDFGVGDNNNFK